jgi:hypothetical protein
MRREVDHSSACSTKVKNQLSYSSTPLFMAWTGTALPITKYKFRIFGYLFKCCDKFVSLTLSVTSIPILKVFRVLRKKILRKLCGHNK